MKLIGIIIFGAGITLICWSYYFFLKISIAIWFPGIAKKQWLEIAKSPNLVGHSFFKWIAPLWVILCTVSVVASVIQYFVVNISE
jgi:hypothetical protein